MKTLTVEVTKDELDRVPDSQLRQALIKVGMWDDDDARDPTQDLTAAWEMVKTIIRRVGNSFELNVGVTDAFNGYGRIENWVAIHKTYKEYCTKCIADPDHSARHSWKREWTATCLSNAFTAPLAICRLALKYSFEQVDE